MRPLGFPRGWKNAVSISIAFCLDVLIRNENTTSEECKTKTVWNNITCTASYKPSKLGGKKIMSRSNLYKWMFYFWLPFQLWRLVTRPTCNIISNSFLFCIAQKLYFQFLIKKSRQKAIEIEIVFFSSPWESQGSHIGSFLLCFTYLP